MIWEAVREFFAGSIILSMVALLSLIGNAYQFLRRRKVDKADLRRDIALKENDLAAMRDRHEQERRELERNYEGEIRVRENSRADLRTEYDRERDADLSNRHLREEERLFAELTHLQELNGERGVLIPMTKMQQAKFEIGRFWRKFLREIGYKK